MDPCLTCTIDRHGPVSTSYHPHELPPRHDHRTSSTPRIPPPSAFSSCSCTQSCTRHARATHLSPRTHILPQTIMRKVDIQPRRRRQWTVDILLREDLRANFGRCHGRCRDCRGVDVQGRLPICSPSSIERLPCFPALSGFVGSGSGSESKRSEYETKA